jgi:lipoprotein-anchoring transpeptidase ErfK/SrfK
VSARSPLHPRSVPLAAAALAVAFVLLLLSSPAQARANAVVWSKPTQADKSRFAATTGKRVVLTLSASASRPKTAISIEPVGGLPRGAVVTSTTGSVARATFRWTPTDVGEYMIRFGAKSGHGAAAPILTYFFDVTTKAKVRVHYPRSYGLVNPRLAHWAPVLKRVAVHAKPSQSSRIVSRLAPDDSSNVVLVLSGVDRSPTKKWYRVRLAILPNNSTGWVPSTALGELVKVNTHLYIDRARFTATLKRNGTTVFTTRIGVGLPYWPTPKGEFYIRDRFTNFGNPFYGPVAFLTSARSPVLTDWPGGGFVGVHGTNQPGILPGRVSHGCIRIRNEEILRLARLMKVGTPLTIR